MGFWKSTGRFTGNTVGVAPRIVGTGVRWVIDGAQSIVNIASDMATVAKDTNDRLWETLTSAWNTGKWYNKLYQVPLSPFAGAAEVIEGAVRTVIEPTRNLILNARDTVANVFTNFGSGIRRLFRTDKPVSDFSFNKLEYKKPTWKNWMSRLAAFWKNPNPNPNPNPKTKPNTNPKHKNKNNNNKNKKNKNNNIKKKH